MRLRRCASLSLVGVLLIAACAGCGSVNQSSARQEVATPSPVSTPTPTSETAAATPPKLDVPYVPTPHNVVARMLKLAKVGPKDIVYDLGSGDGRIVITAAQKYKSRGVGFDIDPKRIQEANENARTAGVTDRVRFVQQDLFTADLSEATVVTLYLLPDINLKLRPKLLKELKPGTRIVSHNYGLGDWDPITTETLTSGGGEHLVFYWVVPKPGTFPN